MSAFDVAFSETVGLEGGYSSDEHDPGNWTGGEVDKGELRGTMFGISAKAYPNIDIAALSVAKAKDIYRNDFWGKMRCDALPDEVAIALFKQGVNMGCEGAVKHLQGFLRTVADGNVGQMTIGLATKLPPKEVVCGFLTECAMAYTKMPNFDKYGKGWLSRVIQTAVEAST